MFLGLALNTWLGLTVLGAIVSTFGSLLGVVLKEYFFSRSFERWKQRQSLEQVYQRFRDPLFLSAQELASRTMEILDHYPTVYLSEAVRASRPAKQVKNSIDDPYFRRYKLISTAYRLSAFMAWVELYRQELTFLHPGGNANAAKLKSIVDLIRSDLADGQLNDAGDWDAWRDTLIFREELRAIGESLIEVRGVGRTVMGYGRYCEQMEAESSNAVKRWSPVVFSFLLDLLPNGKDFRQIRIKRLFVHLVDLMRIIDAGSIESRTKDAYSKLRVEMT